jgi:hypothetical protein
VTPFATDENLRLDVLGEGDFGVVSVRGIVLGHSAFF